MNIKKFYNFKVNESISFQSDYGFYNMCNANDDFINELQNLNISDDCKYNHERNYLIIQTDNPKPIVEILNNNAIRKMSADEESYAMEDPNDCILLKVKTPPNPPTGAFM